MRAPEAFTTWAHILNVLLQDAADLFGLSHTRIGAKGSKLLHDALVTQQLHKVAVDLADHGLRRASGTQL